MLSPAPKRSKHLIATAEESLAQPCKDVYDDLTVYRSIEICTRHAFCTYTGSCARTGMHMRWGKGGEGWHTLGTMEDLPV